MKSFIKAFTIIIILALIPTAWATAQITPAPAPAPAPAQSQKVIYELDKTPDSRLRDLNEKLIQLNIATSGQHGGGKVLVIPTAEIKPQDMVTLMEDMTVMCRIFDKKLAQSNLVPGTPFIGRVTLPSTFSLDNGSIEAMYIQGYGALFMTTVDFPLSPPPQTEEQEEAKEEDADPVWEQMKQEIFSPQEAAKRTSDRPEEKYDARKVKNLKSTLIEALVHAANIRGLKPDEFVVLTVTREAGWSDPLATRLYGSGDSRFIATASGGTKSGTLSPTVLTIRAKKSYVDALAQNKISFDQFQEKIQLLSYPCLGENLSRGSSPSFLGGETISIGPGSSSAGRSIGRSGRRSSGRDDMESSGIDEMGQSSRDRRRCR